MHFSEFLKTSHCSWEPTSAIHDIKYVAHVKSCALHTSILEMRRHIIIESEPYSGCSWSFSSLGLVTSYGKLDIVNCRLFGIMCFFVLFLRFAIRALHYFGLDQSSVFLGLIILPLCSVILQNSLPDRCAIQMRFYTHNWMRTGSGPSSVYASIIVPLATQTVLS